VKNIGYEVHHYAVFLHDPSSSLLDPNILFNTLFSKILSLCSSPEVEIANESERGKFAVVRNKAPRPENFYNGGEWLASHIGCFAINLSSSSTHFIKFCMGHLHYMLSDNINFGPYQSHF